MIHVALIGGAHIHTPGFAKLIAETEGVKVKYVWDPNDTVAAARQKVTGGEIITDPKQAFADRDVAGVVICSQTRLHESLVIPAAEAGKHLFVEKPLGFKADDAKRMAAAIEKAGVLFQTGFFMRTLPPVQGLKQLIDTGKLGHITRLRMSNCHQGALVGLFDTEWRWMADANEAGCGGFGDLGAHALDMLLWLMGEAPVADCTATLGNTTQRYGQIDEFGEGMLRFESGTIATMAASWLDRANPNFLEVTGIDGHARITDGKLYFVPAGSNAVATEPVADLPPAQPAPLTQFLRSLGGEKHPLVTAQEAAWRGIVMAAMYSAAQDRSWVKP